MDVVNFTKSDGTEREKKDEVLKEEDKYQKKKLKTTENIGQRYTYTKKTFAFIYNKRKLFIEKSMNLDSSSADEEY